MDTKTKVKIGFEYHGLPLIEGKIEEMKKADLVIAESIPEDFDEFKKAETDEERRKIAEQNPKVGDPEMFYQESKLLLDIWENIEAIGVVTGQHKTVQKLEEKDPDVLKALEKGEITPEQQAKWIKLRDKYRAKNIYEDVLKKQEHQGKNIYIQAGAIHTLLYDNLEKMTQDEENIELERIFLPKKELSKRTGIDEEDIDTEDLFKPTEKLTRMELLNKETVDNTWKMRELKDNDKDPEKYFKEKYSSNWKDKLKEAEKTEERIKELWKKNEEYKSKLKEIKEKLIDEGFSPSEARGEARLRILAQNLKKRQ